jgi:hypothetical protein
MAKPAVMERLAGGVFDPPVAYRDLADFHLDFGELGPESPESEVRERAEKERGCCAVIGVSGAGKSSLIASVAASLQPTRFPVRIQGVTSVDALTREGFAYHLARETLRAFSEITVGPPRRRTLRPARTKLASSVQTRSAGVKGSVSVPLPADFKAEVTSRARAITEERDPVAVGQAVEELVQVTTGFERRLLLIVEDTDVFMPPNPLNATEGERPQRFIEQVLEYLARELPTTSLVAVNSRYAERLPKGVISTVSVPRLRAPALARLIEHYAARNGLALERAEDVIEPEALTYLAGRYAETRDVRRTLELLHKAARKMVGEERGARISVEVLHGL